MAPPTIEDLARRVAEKRDAHRDANERSQQAHEDLLKAVESMNEAERDLALAVANLIDSHRSS